MDVIISSLIAKNTTKLCIPGVTSQTLAVMDLESLVGPEDGLDMGTDKKSSSDFSFEPGRVCGIVGCLMKPMKMDKKYSPQPKIHLC